MKLSLVTETFPPEINGVSMTLGRLVDGLHKRQVSISVVAPGRKDRPEGLNKSHRLHRVPGLPIPRYTELRFGLPAHQSLRNLWMRDCPDIVHVATEGPLGWSACEIADELELPVVSSFHTNFHKYGSHYGFGFIQAWVLNWLRHFHNRTLRTFVPSGDMIHFLGDKGFENLRLFARGVDTDLFGPHRRDERLRRSWGVEKSTPVALYAGRLAGEKNLSLMIDAYHVMRRSLPGLKLVLVGDGPERKHLQTELPEVHFAGMQRDEILATHYASADVFLFASTTETFGNVVTEAMASALPVLAYDYAAPGRFIQSGKNGLLAPYNDASAFLAQAEHLASVQSLWQKMGTAARNTMLPHSWDTIIDSYLYELKSIPCLRP